MELLSFLHSSSDYQSCSSSNIKIYLSNSSLISHSKQNIRCKIHGNRLDLRQRNYPGEFPVSSSVVFSAVVQFTHQGSRRTCRHDRACLYVHMKGNVFLKGIHVPPCLSYGMIGELLSSWKVSANQTNHLKIVGSRSSELKNQDHYQ